VLLVVVVSGDPQSHAGRVGDEWIPASYT